MQTLNICRTWMNNKPFSGLVTHLQVPGAGEEEEEAKYFENIANTLQTLIHTYSHLLLLILTFTYARSLLYRCRVRKSIRGNPSAEI